MARVAGVDLPDGKQAWIALTYVMGIGRALSRKVLKTAGIEPAVLAKDLTDEQTTRINAILDKEYVVEGELRRQISQNIQRLKEIACYRGIRHRKGLPVRGQRTKTNARTRKGPRKTVAVKRSVKELT